MTRNIAIVRKHLEKIQGVSRTWIELSDEDGILVKTLVVEITDDTDANSADYNEGLLGAIHETATEVLQHETTMVISHLKIVPKL